MAAPGPPRSSQRQEVWHGSPSPRRSSSGQTLPLIDPSREFEDIYSRMGQLLNLAFWDVGIGLAGAPGLWRNDEVAFHGGDSGGGGGCGPGGAGLFE
jgi:hypothetical protein